MLSKSRPDFIDDYQIKSATTELVQRFKLDDDALIFFHIRDFIVHHKVAVVFIIIIDHETFEPRIAIFLSKNGIIRRTPARCKLFFKFGIHGTVIQ